MVFTKTLSMADHFSWQEGLSWIQQEWLYDLLLYTFIALLGTTAMLLLHIVTLMVSFYGVGIQKKIKSKGTYLVYALAAFFLLPLNRGNRPSEFSSWAFIGLIWIYRNCRHHGPFYLFLLSVVMANFHGGTLMTLLITALILTLTELVWEFVDKKCLLTLSWKEHLLPLGVMFAGSLCNPSFFKMWKISLTLPGWESTQQIQEWMPWEQTYFTGFFILLTVLALGYGLHKHGFLKTICQDIAIVCAFLIATIASMKAGTILFVLQICIAYPYVEEMLTDSYTFLTKKAFSPLCISSKTAYATLYLLAAVAISVIFMFPAEYDVDFTQHVNKEVSGEIIEYLKEQPKGTKIFHGYGEGNILLFHDIKVFIDSRQFLYATENGQSTSLDDFLKVEKKGLPDPEDIKTFLETYEFEYLYVTENTSNMEWYLGNYESGYECIKKDSTTGEALWKKQ